MSISEYGFGRLAMGYGGRYLPNQVCKSAAGYYIGTQDEDRPYSRESEEYYDSAEEAQLMLKNKTFTQRWNP